MQRRRTTSKSDCRAFGDKTQNGIRNDQTIMKNEIQGFQPRRRRALGHSNQNAGPNERQSFHNPKWDSGNSVQGTKRNAKHPNQCARQGSRYPVKMWTRFEASEPKRRLELLAFSHITSRKQRIFLDAKRPAEAGLSISNGAGERT